MNEKKKWEQEFSLTGDPQLRFLGVKIIARAEVDPKYQRNIRNRIVLKRGNKEAVVHTTVYTRLLGVISLEYQQVELSPEENFFALKSYVAAIAKAGIFPMIDALMQGKGEDLPFGFNQQLRSQMIGALTKVVPKAIENLFFKSVINRPMEWVIERIGLLSKIFPIDLWSVFAGNLHIEVIENLAGDKDLDVLKAVAENVNIPTELLEKLAGSENMDVRTAVAENVNTPVRILEKLAGDKNYWVR